MRRASIKGNIIQKTEAWGHLDLAQANHRKV